MPVGGVTYDDVMPPPDEVDGADEPAEAAAEADGPRPDAKARLLGAVVEYVAAHGMGDMSLRQLAAAVGTSHRMLIYHFGSKEGLMVEVVKTIDAQQLTFIDKLSELLREDPAALTARAWQGMSDEGRAPYQRLLFEAMLRAMQGQQPAEQMMREATGRWLTMLESLALRLGVPESGAKTHARLALAVARGLTFDMMITGEREEIEKALERFMRSYSCSELDFPASDPAQTPRPAEAGPTPGASDSRPH